MSVVNTEMSLEVQRVVIMIFSIDLGEARGVTFLTSFRKRGCPEKKGAGNYALFPEGNYALFFFCCLARRPKK